MSDINDTAGEARRGPGRPSNAERAARNADRVPDHVGTPDPNVRMAEHDIEHATPRVRSRTRMRVTDVDNPFYIPTDEIPEGSSYEWKRFTNVGQENPFYIAQMRRQGWEPVEPKMHPNWLPPGYNQPHIVKEGMILMERPIQLTREALQEQRTLARQQVREAEQRLGMAPKVDGIETGTRSLPQVQPRLTKEYGRMVSVPVDD